MLWGRKNWVFLQAIPTTMQIKLTEIIVSLSRNKNRFKIKYIIPLNYLCAVDDEDLGKEKEKCTCKTIYLFWPTGNFLATFW